MQGPVETRWCRLTAPTSLMGLLPMSQTARTKLFSRGVLLLAALLLLVPGSVRAAGPTEAQLAGLRAVLPAADVFTEQEGQPPVFKAYRTEPESEDQTLVGYAFLTSDVPPEVIGYSGRIEVLVGIDLEGTLTGIRVVRYREAISRILGDFFRRPGFQEQFAGKPITDPFRVGRDVDNITRATISVAALARGVRTAARRVAAAYLREPDAAAPPDLPLGIEADLVEQLERLLWPELLFSGLVTRITIGSADPVGLELSFAYLGSEALGQLLLGPSMYTQAHREADARVQERHLLLVGVDGTLFNLFRPETLAIQQGAATFPVSQRDFILLGEPQEGKIAGQAVYVGVLLLDRAVDIGQPFTILYDLRPGMGLFSSEYSLPSAVQALTEERLVPVGAPAGQAMPPSAPSLSTTSRTPAPALAPADAAAPPLTFAVVEEETVLARLIAEAPWGRVVPLMSLFGLVLFAFLRKNARARWVALAATLVYLGFMDGGFLSISHIISGFQVGPAVYLRDLPLLLLVGFTLTTTFLWGRVFCGFLCPFGALQEVLERVVPRRLQWNMPQKIHDQARYIKYGILGGILAMALIQSDLSIYQYFEPFGTLFFLSPSVVLWSILLILLVASAVVPRFYCRYVCPLGAALGLASLLTLFRIKRVAQCTICKVCQQRCPTGAIRGPAIDFKECVRCDICEVKLLTRAGVCRHSMAEVRVRLRRQQPVLPAR
ncbi:MAG: hypothetical protein CL878_13060 [Dehalococcoidia bacterium]|nr:hypothetical protein [Dehalococcoidia bacterium]